MILSVIIPTRNRSDLLACALASLGRQTLSSREFEVLVVDNGSADDTAVVVQEFANLTGNIRYFFAPEPGLHVGRHLGMLKAQSDILVFADDDIEALPLWLESISEVFKDPAVAMVGGNNLPMFVEPPPQWLQTMWDSSFRRNQHSIPALSILEVTGPSRDFSPHYVWGCNFSIRRQDLLAAGGFNPDGMPKELIRFRGDGETHVSRFIAASGKRCVFHPGASVYHKVTPERMTFEYFRQRGFNQGVSDSFTELRQLDINIARRKRNMLRRLASLGWQQLKRLSFANAETRQALAQMEYGRKEGYAFHQLMYHENEEVRTWVHKLRYFEREDA
jgi:glycosyltransferase involved in cell wall biosynthesis